MTFNALGVTIKGSDETLAEFLGIEMPEEPKATELEVVEVYTENLREVIVELSNAELADEEKLTDVNNYKLVGFTVEKVTVDGDNVIVLLDDARVLARDKEYDLVIRNIHKDMNGTYEFTARDNDIPTVEDVVVLGEYGIKVTTSEPIRNPRERNFLIDGKNVAMRIETYGRDIILTPYYDKAFPENAETLTIKELEDYANFRTVEKEFDIEIVKDEVAPEVVDVLVRGNEVEVVFDKDVYNRSISGYWHRNSVGNISYKDGRHTIYTLNENTHTGSRKVDTNRVVYYFEEDLPRRAEITIEGVENHSRVEMEPVTTEGRIVVDYSEPEIIDSELWDFNRGTEEGTATAIVRIYFDKDVQGIYLSENTEDGFAASRHFDLYRETVSTRNLLTRTTEDYETYFTSVNYVEGRRDVIEVHLQNLHVNNIEREYDYILEVKEFTDTTSFRNRMYRDYVDFQVPRLGTAFRIDEEGIRIREIDSNNEVVRTEITIAFTKAVDRNLAENLANYLVTLSNGAVRDIDQLGGDAIVEGNGFEVTLVIPGYEREDLSRVEVLQSLKDRSGARISGPRVINVTTGTLVDEGQTARALDNAVAAVEAALNEYEVANDEGTEEDLLLAALVDAVDNNAIGVTINDFAMTKATEAEDGSITGEVALSIDDNGTILVKTVEIDITIPALGQSLDSAATAVNDVLDEYEANNSTTKEELLTAIEEVITNEDIEVVIVGFNVQEAIENTEGRVTGIILLRLGNDEEEIEINITIPGLDA